MLVITAGALLGNLFGIFIASIFPTGPVNTFFSLKMSSGFDPVTLNLVITKIVFGFHLTINTAGVLGIITSAVIAKKLFERK